MVHAWKPKVKVDGQPSKVFNLRRSRVLCVESQRIGHIQIAIGSLGPIEHVDKSMVTKLDKPVRREVKIKNKFYIVTISPEGMKLTLKGRRKGKELAWEDWVSGEAALAVALNASLNDGR